MTRLRDHPAWVPLLFDENGTPIPFDLGIPPEKRDSLSKKPRRDKFNKSPYADGRNVLLFLIMKYVRFLLKINFPWDF